eukprot:scaffold98940_cov40-Tisochrysis_lutea.AAC.2
MIHAITSLFSLVLLSEQKLSSRLCTALITSSGVSSDWSCLTVWCCVHCEALAEALAEASETDGPAKWTCRAGSRSVSPTPSGAPLGHPILSSEKSTNELVAAPRGGGFFPSTATSIY